MIDMRVKHMFFDRARVQRAVKDGKRRAMERAGAYVMRVAQNSIKRRDGASAPGKPPHSHIGLLKNWILFAYDEWRSSVVIGPVKMTKPNGVPNLLEFGGVRRNKRKRWVVESSGVGRDVRGRFTAATRSRRIIESGAMMTYPPRPYMGPAYQKAVDRGKVAASWYNSVRGSSA